MLQVDLFFSYGLSAGIALAAQKKLQGEKCVIVNKYFISLDRTLSSRCHRQGPNFIPITGFVSLGSSLNIDRENYPVLIEN